MLTVPDGSAESFSQVDWIACNLAYSPEKWDNARQRAKNQGIVSIPWIRLANDRDSATNLREHLRLLVLTAEAWKSPLILPNYEKESERFPPQLVYDMLSLFQWKGDIGWSMQGWLPNDVDFSPINHDPVLLQIFPADMHFPPNQIEQKISDCVWNARVSHGFTYVGVTYQTYANSVHSWWPLKGTHSVYPGNEIIAADWKKWFP